MLSKLYRAALLAPFGYWSFLIAAQKLGADPAKTLNHRTGAMSLYYLLGNLAIGCLIAFRVRLPAPLRFPLQHRRYLGVVTFVVLVFHFLLYLTMESFERQAYVQIATKIYLTLGFTAWLILLALALTSNDLALRKLGQRRWKKLHRAVYLASAAVTAHVMLIEKTDLVKYGLMLALLWLALGARAVRAIWPTSRP